MLARPDQLPQLAALLFAGALDVAEKADTAGTFEDRFIAIGELLGGLSVSGFRADLASHLSRLEDRILEDATRSEYNPGRGGNDPDHYVSAALSDRIDQACDDAAREWLTAARLIHQAEQVAA